MTKNYRLFALGFAATLFIASCGKKEETQVTADTTTTAPAPDMSAADKFDQHAPQGFDATYDAATATATVTNHEASTDSVKAIMHRHLNSGVNFARKVFEADPQVKTVNVVTTADVKDAQGATHKQAIVAHSFTRDAFSGVNWEETKGKAMVKHLHKALQGGRAIMSKQFAEAAAAVGYITYDHDGDANASATVYGGGANATGTNTLIDHEVSAGAVPISYDNVSTGVSYIGYENTD